MYNTPTFSSRSELQAYIKQHPNTSSIHLSNWAAEPFDDLLSENIKILHVAESELPEEPLPKSLDTLYLYNCSTKTVILPSSLKGFFAVDCPNLQPGNNLPQSLLDLRIVNCEQFDGFTANLPLLSYLHITNCPNFHQTPETWPAKLTRIEIRQCPKFSAMPMAWPKDLSDLAITDCPKLKIIPREWPYGLHKLDLRGCSNLSFPYEWPIHLREANLLGCYKLEHLPNTMLQKAAEGNLKLEYSQKLTDTTQTQEICTTRSQE
jgi:hypothetical protein